MRAAPVSPVDVGLDSPCEVACTCPRGEVHGTSLLTLRAVPRLPHRPPGSCGFSFSCVSPSSITCKLILLRRNDERERGLFVSLLSASLPRSSREEAAGDLPCTEEVACLPVYCRCEGEVELALRSGETPVELGVRSGENTVCINLCGRLRNSLSAKNCRCDAGFDHRVGGRSSPAPGVPSRRCRIASSFCWLCARSQSCARSSSNTCCSRPRSCSHASISSSSVYIIVVLGALFSEAPHLHSPLLDR